MRKLPFFLALSLPLYAALVALSFRGIHFGMPVAEIGDAIRAHEFDYPLQLMYVGLCAALFAIYAWSIWRWSDFALERSQVLGVGLLLGFCAWAAYPGVSSNDILAYVGYGRLMMVHRMNPWEHGYQDVSDAYSPCAWYPYPMPYGPMAAPFFGVAGILSQDSLSLAFYYLKACWLAIHLCNGFLIWRIANTLQSRHAYPPALAAWAYLCNPLLLLELINNGHCDILVVLFGLLSLDRLVRSQETSALMLAGAGLLVKPTIMLLLVAEAAWIVRQGRWRALGVSALLGGCVAAWLFHTLFASEVARESLTNPHFVLNAHSVHSVVVHLIHPDFLTTYDTEGFHTGLRFLGILFAAFCLWRLLRVRTVQDVIREYLWMTLGLVLVYSARVWPWYLSWLVPFAVLLEWGPLRRAVLVYSFTMLAIYAIQFAHYVDSLSAHVARVFLSSVVPLLWLAGDAAWRRKTAAS